MVSFSLLDPQNQRNVTKYWFKTEAVIQIGRSPDNQICIDDDLVSRQHLELHRFNQSGAQVGWQIVNRGTNPTFVNNVLLPKGNSFWLADGDLIQIGKLGHVLLKFQLRCTHFGNAQGSKFCIHCGEPLSKPQQATILEGQTETTLVGESEYDPSLYESLCEWKLRGVRVEEQEHIEQLYQKLSNQGDTINAAILKSMLEDIEQLKRQTPPVINPPAPPPPAPRSELENAELVETKTNVHAGKVVAVAISPNCQTLVSGSSNNQINIWNINTGALAHTLSNYCYTIDIRPDGETFVITSGRYYCIFNMQNVQQVFHLDIAGIGLNQCLAISQDGCQIACTVNNRIISILDIQTGEIICSLVGHSRGNVTSAAFSLDRKKFVSGDSNGIIKIWRLGTAELPRIITGHSGAINFLAISPDGQNIVSCSADNTINILNLDTGELLHTLTGNAKVIAISPDSQTLVSGGGKEINIWEMGTGQLLKTLGSYSPEVTSVAISSDGQMLVTGGSDGTIQIWRVR